MADNPVLVALNQQLDCYQRLAKLARTQHEHVQHSRTEELLLILSQRQTLLAEVAEPDEIVALAKQGWQDFLNTLCAEDRCAAESLLRKTRGLLADIAASDLKDSIVLQQRKFKLGREINQTTAARKFNRQYAAAAYGQPRSALDRQS